MNEALDGCLVVRPGAARMILRLALCAGFCLLFFLVFTHRVYLGFEVQVLGYLVGPLGGAILVDTLFRWAARVPTLVANRDGVIVYKLLYFGHVVPWIEVEDVHFFRIDLHHGPFRNGPSGLEILLKTSVTGAREEQFVQRSSFRVPLFLWRLSHPSTISFTKLELDRPLVQLRDELLALKHLAEREPGTNA